MIWAGMQLSEAEVIRLNLSASSLAQAQQVAALQPSIGGWHCQRCGQLSTATLPDGTGYCAACVGLGRLTEKDHLYRFPNVIGRFAAELTWPGTLTSSQAKAGAALAAAVRAGQPFLLWAVTGAGKTEMLFPVIAAVLAGGQRVAVVSPRVDVVRELAPRLQAAFANTPMVVRYGGAPWPQADSALVVATTHQMLRYYHAFALVIVDEVDAFPYPESPMLAYGVKHAASGDHVFLSATPPKGLQQAAARNKMATGFLARRFHGHDLPVPKLILDSLRQAPHRLSPLVRKQIQAAMHPPGQRLLLFVPDLQWLVPVARILTGLGLRTAAVHAQAKTRKADVSAFRAHELDALVTTTILERGVTIPGCGVIVLAADSSRYSAAGLVQMAGRAGRAPDRPADSVIFIARHYTASIKQAKAEIAAMNRRKEPS